MSTQILAVLALWRDSSDYLERSLAQFDAMEAVLEKGWLQGGVWVLRERFSG
jgi:hypothetical protein